MPHLNQTASLRAWGLHGKLTVTFKPMDSFRARVGLTVLGNHCQDDHGYSFRVRVGLTRELGRVANATP